MDVPEDPSGQEAAAFALCEVTGKIVPEDELVRFQGKRVCMEGKQILLDRIMRGEDNASPAGETRLLARRQRALLRLVLAYIGIFILSAAIRPDAPVLASILVPLVYLVILISAPVLVYRMAKSLGSRFAWGYAIMLFIPLVGMISMLILNSRATARLRDSGLRVGLMGVSRESLDNLNKP